MEKSLYTLKEIAHRLKLPESTVRKYRDVFEAYIPYVGSGRERRYREEAGDVFREIRDCRENKHLSWEDTEVIIADKFPMNAEACQSRKRAAISAEEALEIVERLEGVMDSMNKAAGRQEFLMTTLAGQILRFGEMAKKINVISDNVDRILRSSYSYNEVVQRQNKEYQKDAETIKKMIGVLQGGNTKIRNHIDRKIEFLESRIGKGIKSAEQGKSEFSDVNETIENELRQARREADKYRGLYFQLAEEMDKAKSAMTEHATDQNDNLDERVTKALGERKEASHIMEEETAGFPVKKPASKGGRLFLRGRKK